MTTHLSPEEFVAAVDGALAADRMPHVAECASCGAQLRDLEALLRDTTDTVPEPSPFFWDHFSARVRAATSAESTRPLPGWLAWWRPAVGVAAVAAFTLVLLTTRAPGMPVPGAGSSPVASALPTEDSGPAAVAVTAEGTGNTADVPLGLVIQIASSFSSEDIDRIVSPASDSGVLVDELTPQERQAFVRLLRIDMGGGE